MSSITNTNNMFNFLADNNNDNDNVRSNMASSDDDLTDTIDDDSTADGWNKAVSAKPKKKSSKKDIAVLPTIVPGAWGAKENDVQPMYKNAYKSDTVVDTAFHQRANNREKAKLAKAAAKEEFFDNAKEYLKERQETSNTTIGNLANGMSGSKENVGPKGQKNATMQTCVLANLLVSIFFHFYSHCFQKDRVVTVEKQKKQDINQKKYAKFINVKVPEDKNNNKFFTDFYNVINTVSTSFQNELVETFTADGNRWFDRTTTKNNKDGVSIRQKTKTHFFDFRKNGSDDIQDKSCPINDLPGTRINQIIAAGIPGLIYDLENGLLNKATGGTRTIKEINRLPIIMLLQQMLDEINIVIDNDKDERDTTNYNKKVAEKKRVDTVLHDATTSNPSDNSNPKSIVDVHDETWGPTVTKVKSGSLHKLGGQNRRWENDTTSPTQTLNAIQTQTLNAMKKKIDVIKDENDAVEDNLAQLKIDVIKDENDAVDLAQLKKQLAEKKKQNVIRRAELDMKKKLKAENEMATILAELNDEAEKEAEMENLLQAE